MKRWKVKVFHLVFILGLLMLLAGVVSAQERKTFPIGKKGAIQAIMCFTQDAAEVFAKLKGQRHPMLQHLIQEGYCIGVQGFGMYVKRVHAEGDWFVWEVHFGDNKMYEATDWKSEAES